MWINGNPNLYEINTRVWINRFNTDDKKATLDDVPETYWDDLRAKGIDYIWLMGVWETSPALIDRCNFEQGLVESYGKALKDWQNDDVIGSPYAINKYEINEKLGNHESLRKLKSLLNKKGMKLILDYVPNHFGADTPLLESMPEIFLSATHDYFDRDSHTFYCPFDDNRVFAHGRDPFFPAWQDTVQVNYFSLQAREFMIKTMISLTHVCDGVRCDMAMLALNNVFRNTWGGILSNMGFEKPQDEFWKVAIEIVKNYSTGFIFIAEAYWDLEWELQQLGFDYTYDKKLTDRLRAGDVKNIRDHLHAEKAYQKKSIRFLENHDEERAVTSFGPEKTKAAAVIAYTLQGMHFFYDGQFEGKKVKLPVQLGREPKENENKRIKECYDKLLDTINHEIFKKGVWDLLETLPSWEGNESYKKILAWQWRFHGERRLIVVNYTDSVVTCRLKLDVQGYPETFWITDLLDGETYLRSAEEVYHTGLFIELKNYHSHIFAY